MRADPAYVQPEASLVFVRSTDDMEQLIKESQHLAGSPGRTFVISGADRLFYRLLPHKHGFRVQRIDDNGQVLHSQDLLTFEFLEHSLVEALQAGQLFAAPLAYRPAH